MSIYKEFLIPNMVNVDVLLQANTSDKQSSTR